MQLRLPQTTVSTACIFLHRFYMRFSLKEFHYYDIAATSLFLATKSEETGRKLKDIVIACAKTALKDPHAIIDEQSKDYWRWRDTILYNEELLLEALCFDLTIAHPYAALKQNWRRLSEHMEVGKVMWNCANDTYRSTICLSYDNNVIAAACLFYASVYCSQPLSTIEDKLWHEILGVDTATVGQLIISMIELYRVAPQLAKEGLDSKSLMEAGNTALQILHDLEQEKLNPAESNGKPEVLSSNVQTNGSESKALDNQTIQKQANELETVEESQPGPTREQNETVKTAAESQELDVQQTSEAHTTEVEFEIAPTKTTQTTDSIHDETAALADAHQSEPITSDSADADMRDRAIGKADDDSEDTTADAAILSQASSLPIAEPQVLSHGELLHAPQKTSPDMVQKELADVVQTAGSPVEPEKPDEQKALASPDKKRKQSTTDEPMVLPRRSRRQSIKLTAEKETEPFTASEETANSPGDQSAKEGTQEEVKATIVPEKAAKKTPIRRARRSSTKAAEGPEESDTQVGSVDTNEVAVAAEDGEQTEEGQGSSPQSSPKKGAQKGKREAAPPMTTRRQSKRQKAV